jgi:hypothetical protein
MIKPRKNGEKMQIGMSQRQWKLERAYFDVFGIFAGGFRGACEIWHGKVK